MKDKYRQREEKLIRALATNKKLNVADAIELLGVSKSTARRLFIDMEEKGVVVRSYGGVQLATSEGYSFDISTQRYNEEKDLIGKAACTFVENGDTIFMDSGTTMMGFALNLAQLLKEKAVESLTIFTNSIANLNILSPVTNITLIGGEYRPARKDFYGYLSEQMVENIHFTKCFLGTDGIAKNMRFTATDFQTASLNAVVLRHSSCRIILFDHSKFSSTALVTWGSLSDAEVIITDKKSDARELAAITSAGKQLVTV